MSAQQNRSFDRGFRSREGYTGLSRGGFAGQRRGGPTPTQQQFQPSYPTPQSSFNAMRPYLSPPHINPAGLLQTPAGTANTVREETTTTTYTAEGKTVTTVRTVEVGQEPEYGNQAFNPNHQFQVNVPPPIYQGQYQNTIPLQQGTGQIRPRMSQPLPQNRTYNDRHISGRPPRSRGGHPRGLGRNNPSFQETRQQPRSKSMERQTLLQGQRSLSLADIAIYDDDTGDKAQTMDAEKMKKNPEWKKKGQAQTEDSVGDKESSLNDVLSGLDNLSPSNATAIYSKNNGHRVDAKEKAESNDTRKGRPSQWNENENKEDENVNNIETIHPGNRSKTSKSVENSNSSSGPNIQAVFDFMVKEMNGKGSPEEIRTKSGLFPMFNLANVEQWFRRFKKKFKIIVRDSHVIIVLAYAHELNYCRYYYSKRSCNKNICQRYHMCKDYLSGKCDFGTECNHSHDLFDETSENMSISKKNGYHKRYSNQQMLALMQCRYPHVCHEWNQQKACRDACCHELHMCENFFQGRCESGEDCMYGHDRMSEHNTPIVEAYAMASWKDYDFGRTIFIKRNVERSEHEAENDDDDAHDGDDVLDTGLSIGGGTVDATKSGEVFSQQDMKKHSDQDTQVALPSVHF